MWPLSFQGNINMPVYPLLLGRVVHYEGFKIMIWSPVLSRDFVENGVSYIFKLQEDVLELIVIFEAIYPSINTCKNVRR